MNIEQNTGKPFVYVLGSIGYDFGDSVRNDYFRRVRSWKYGPDDAGELLDYLRESPQSAPDIVWTLDIGDMPVYAIRPVCPFTTNTYAKLRELLRDQISCKDHRVALPGYLNGRQRLMSKKMVPVLVPALYGIRSWSLDSAKTVPSDAFTDESDIQHPKQEPGNAGRRFLERIIHERRNFGIRPEERAINYAVAIALETHQIFESAASESLELHSITAERNLFNGPNTDLWDVTMVFFNPERMTTSARHTYRLTVNIVDVVPTTVGRVRKWHVF